MSVPEQFTYIGPQLQFPVVWAIVAVFAATTGVLFAIGVKVGRSRYGDINGFTFSGWVMAVLTALVGAAFVVGHIPFESKYWAVYSTIGTVETVSNTFADGDGDVTVSAYVTSLDTLDSAVVIRDPRAIGLEGATVDLRCTIEWVDRAADRYNCSIAEVKP